MVVMMISLMHVLILLGQYPPDGISRFSCSSCGDDGASCAARGPWPLPGC